MIELETSALLPAAHIGWIETQLPKTAMMRLENYIDAAKKDPINHNGQLAGNISKSLLIEDKDGWFFQTIVLQLIHQLTNHFPEYPATMDILTENAPYCLDTFWVNFQKQHDFNPLHNHVGIYSFVIFVKIPTDWKEQHTLPFSAASHTPKASDFDFHWAQDGIVRKHTYLLDKTSEGTMLFFPAKLMHIVYPFYECEEERITISGNIRFDISENAMKQFRLGKYKGL